jgi:hypothetical protein
MSAAIVADLRAEMVENEQPYRRRQITVVAVGIDRGYQVRQR